MATATRFIQPMNYGGTYPTSWAGYKFKETLGYTSGRHTGVDYNGAGGGNTDLGMQIRSIANGIVRYTGNNSSIGFGNTTIIEYPLPSKLKTELGCDSLFGRYLHQQSIQVGVGQEVTIGQGIGTVGNTGTQWAHLHLDLYKNTISGGGVHLRYDKDTQLASYVDPFVFIDQHQTETSDLLGYQRVVGASGVNHREAPTISAPIRKEWAPGEVLDFKGYVKGDSVNGNDNWFVGRYTGGYLWSGAFLDTGTHDLDNLTTSVPPPAPVQPVYPPESTDPTVTQVVNKKHPAGSKYAPTDLVPIGNATLRNEPANAIKLMQMIQPMTPQSGYRSYEAQETLYNNYVKTDGEERADTYSARPGYSEHQLGLAIDFAPIEDTFKNKAEFTWLTNNAYKYGFVLRYPEDKTSITGYMYEPWHWRYIGVKDATDMHNKGIKTLEEYYNIEGGGYADEPIEPPVVIPIEPDYDKENNTLLKQILQIVQDIWNKLIGVFK